RIQSLSNCVCVCVCVCVCLYRRIQSLSLTVCVCACACACVLDSGLSAEQLQCDSTEERWDTPLVEEVKLHHLLKAAGEISLQEVHAAAAYRNACLGEEERGGEEGERERESEREE